jgi:hypothetical protein
VLRVSVYDLYNSDNTISAEDVRGPCTATIIAPQAIITAKHCVVREGESAGGGLTYRNVRVGIVRGNQDEPGLEFRNTVTRTVDHPSRDVSISFLAAQESGSFVQLAAEQSEVPPAGTRMTIVGYGRSTASGPSESPLKLKGTAVVGSPWEPQFITVVPGPTGQITCRGDSGGPVFDDVEQGATALQIGVLSGGPANCATRSNFTRTDLIFDWIQDQVPEVNGGSGGPGPGVPTPGCCAESAGVGAAGFGIVLLGGLRRRRRKS